MKTRIRTIVQEIFDSSQQPQKPLFIFELANNHMGDVSHGAKIIDEVAKVAKKFPYYYAFKFQFRDINTFIHPFFKGNTEHKYVKRFTETSLNKKQFLRLKRKLDEESYVTIATPFDEPSVDLLEDLEIPIIKIASCSFTDWPLLERITKNDKPIIASTAGVDLEDIDKVVSFFRHRNKRLILMHCVGEYPTVNEKLNLNQIDLLKNRYTDVRIGFSTHEDPSNIAAAQMAVAKGVMVFEKHVALKTKRYDVNSYSASPDQIRLWLDAATRAFDAGGAIRSRSVFSKKEIADLRQFQRGVFAKNLLKKGDVLGFSDLYFAFPNHDSQLVANDLSKYNQLELKCDIKKDQPIYHENVKKSNVREKIYKIVTSIQRMLKQSGVPVPKSVDLEISHHYGLDKFYKYGLTMITVINREYCKKLLIMLPGQEHPIQYHKRKEETFNILYGEFIVYLNGRLKICKPGDVIVIERGTKHRFATKTGGILEEISSTHYRDDSYYVDKEIHKNKNRKTYITHWLGN